MRTVSILLILAICAAPATAERVKDIVTVQGQRDNPLVGVGLVVGLKGTGDNSAVTKRLVASMYQRMGVNVTEKDINAADVASVTVTASLGPFDRIDGTIDVQVQTVAGAKSLRGGKLLMTLLRGADGETYAVAQGNLVVGGFSATGKDASITQGHLNVGSIPDGARVEQEVLGEIVQKDEIVLLLQNADSTTAENVAKAINDEMKAELAHAADPGSIRVRLPKGTTAKTVNRFVDRIGQLNVKVDQKASVLINEKTGTIIIGKNVTISTVGLTQGNLTITVEEKDYFVGPGPFTGDNATGEKISRTNITATQKEGIIRVVPKTLTVVQLADALNAMGMTPTDMISIFQGLKDCNALQAELIVK